MYTENIKKFIFAIGPENIFSKQNKMPVTSDIPKYNRHNTKNVSNTQVRKLGKYKSYVWREKMLKKEIFKTAKVKSKLEQGLTLSAEERNIARKKDKFIELWLELSQVQLKKKEIENMYNKVKDPFIKNVIKFRYFDNPEKRLADWSKTAADMGLSLSGTELKHMVNNELNTLI